MKFTKGICCLLLAVLMTFSFTACKKGGTVSELSDEIEYIYQYESAPANNGGTAENDTAADKNDAGNSANKGDSADKNSADKNAGNADKNNADKNQNGQGSANTSNNKGNANDSYDAKAAKYKGTKVVLATWRDPNIDEDGPVIKSFQKKYGIEVKIDTIGQGTYVNTVASRIAAGDAPDIYFCTATFPSGVQCLQPIDVAEIDLTDPIWDQTMLEKSKINGKSYLVNTVGNIWNEIACVFYNKKIFRDNNITTPEEYYNAGNWTFETFEKAMREVTEASKDYTGAYIDYNALLGSTKSAYWNWKDGKFSNGVNSRFSDVISAVASWKKDGLIRGVANQSYTSDFKNGKCGLALCEAWGLKRTGYWRNMNFEDIGFTYLPAFDKNSKAATTGIYRGWGICKGAKNPVAAGVFLRYYLDVNNYDTASAFITPEAESFFFKLTSSGNMSDKTYYFIGGSDGLSTATSHAKIAAIANGDPSQVKSSLNALKNTIDSDVKDLNNFIAKQK